MNNWSNAQIISPFLADGAVVGLVVNLDGRQTAMRFTAIEDRVKARREEIDNELSKLAAWWLDKATDPTPANLDRCLTEDGRLQAERRFLEALWQQVRSYMPPGDFYCVEHGYNPQPNSGFSFCPLCEVES